MKKHYAAVLIFLTFAPGHGQQLQWAKTLSLKPGAFETFLAADEQGNVFQYGTIGQAAEGFIKKFDNSGNQVFSLQFTGDVSPKSMSPGPDGRMFIAGRYSGQAVIGNTVFVSTGKSDGFVAGINSNGGFDWVTTIAGSRDDDARTVVYNQATNRLLVSGGIRSSFSWNSTTYETHPEGALYLAEADLNGDLLRYRLHDFRTNDTSGNVGLELRADEAGNYYLLHRREGVPWYDDTTKGPADGTYLSGLDGNLDPQWSQFIINNGCYYGARCSGITCTGTGDVYVPYFCSGKYGGDGRIGGYNASGVPSFNLDNQDGYYAGLASDGMNVYAVGTESANGCPCESNFPGYRVIRRIGPAGDQSLLAVFAHTVALTNLAASKNGMVFVSGHFNGEKVQIGSFTLLNQNNDGGVQHFLLAFSGGQVLSAGTDIRPDLFTVFPNPASGEFQVVLEDGANLVEVSNLLGQTLRSYRLSGRGKTSVRVADLPPGVCIVTAILGPRRQAKPVIIR